MMLYMALPYVLGQVRVTYLQHEKNNVHSKRSSSRSRIQARCALCHMCFGLA